MRGYRWNLGALFILVASVMGGPAAAWGPYPDGPYLWEGFYIGGQGGLSFGEGLDVTSHSKFTFVRGFVGEGGQRITEDTQENSIDADGGFVGGLVGYNFQRRWFVYGVEADLNASDINLGSLSVSSFAPGSEPEDYARGNGER